MCERGRHHTSPSPVQLAYHSRIPTSRKEEAEMSEQQYLSPDPSPPSPRRGDPPDRVIARRRRRRRRHQNASRNGSPSGSRSSTGTSSGREQHRPGREQHRLGKAARKAGTRQGRAGSRDPSRLRRETGSGHHTRKKSTPSRGAPRPRVSRRVRDRGTSDSESAWRVPGP
jgi:hypothetical protein